MSEPTDQNTPFSTKAEILGELWLNYRNDEEFLDFIEYNDLGLPLAYAIAHEIIQTTPIATKYVEETFDLLLAGLGVEDANYSNLDDLLEASSQ